MAPKTDLPTAWKPFSEKTDATDPPSTVPHKSLVSKLSEVMAAVERVAKRGHNQHFNYDFATESDITAAIRKELAARQIMMVPHVESLTWRQVQTRNGVNDVCCAMVEFNLYDGESGDAMKFRIPGEGQDAGDKCVPKALTSALKYALLKLFMIPTGDDPERDTAKAPTPATRKKDARLTPDAPATLVNTKTGEEVPAGEKPEPPLGYFYITDYVLKNGWHEMTLPGYDAQGGALHVSTKLSKVGEAAKQAFQMGVPVRVDVTMKKDGKGEAYLNAVEPWRPDGGVHTEPLDASLIPF